MKITRKSFDKCLKNAYALVKNIEFIKLKENKNTAMKINIRSNRTLALLLATVLAAGNILLMAPPANALALKTTYIRLNRLAAGTTTTFRIQFQTQSAGATSVAINFNGADTTTWTGSSGAIGAQGSQTDSSTACVADTGDTALPGTHTFTVSSGTLTIGGVTALQASYTYCDDLTYASAVTTPTAGTYHPTITVGSDSTTIAETIISNDQIIVTAVVPPSFTFSLSPNTDAFTTNLAAGSVVSTTGVTAGVTTNAKNGWIAWASSKNAGLTSVAAGKTIASTTPGTTATLVAGTEGYVSGVTSVAQGTGSGGTTAATTAYDATASGGINAKGSGLDTTIRPIVTSNGTAGTGTQFVLTERAAISALTPAATDYTDTITVIGAGSF